MISAHLKYKVVIQSFKNVNDLGRMGRSLTNSAVLPKKHGDDSSSYYANQSNWAWHIVDNNPTAGEQFVKEFILNEVQDISMAAEKYSIGLPESTKWNWTGEPQRLGEGIELSASENVKIAQHYGKYMSKKVKESETASYSYGHIGHEAKQLQYTPDLEIDSNFEINSPG